MNKQHIEKELAYEWRGPAHAIDSLKTIANWGKEVREYTISDSTYDTIQHDLAQVSTGVRVRTIDTKTVMTAKTFLRRGSSGEGIFKERHVTLTDGAHPTSIDTAVFDLNLPPLYLERQLSLTNNRIEAIFRKSDGIVRVINEDITYSNSKSVYREPLLEIEFEHVSDDVIEQVRQEVESTYAVRLIHEGKTDRAMRLLSSSSMHIENVTDVKPVIMPAHGGKGTIRMRFFHTAFSRFKGAGEPKVTNYTDGKWEFFAHATLPVGAEVKEHLHDRTDEIYFILKGSATFAVDGETRTVKPGDCILTRKNSRHSLTNVTEDLEFLATEIL